MIIGEYTLKPKQEEAVEHLLTMKHSILSFKPGKGKTLPAIYAVCEYSKQLLSQNIKPKIIIISKKKVIEEMWKKDIEPLALLPPHEYINVEKLTRDKGLFEFLKLRKYDICLVDEAHLLKNPTSKQSKEIWSLTKDIPLVIGLTGTPRCNSDEDLFGILHSLNCGNWGKMNKTMFEKVFGELELKRFGGHTFNVFKGIKENKKEEFENLIKNYFLSWDYEDADKMPDLNINEHLIPFDPKEKYYSDALEGFMQFGNYESVLQAVTKLSKAHQAANGYMYYTEERKVFRIPDWKNEKLKTILQLLADNSSEKCIIVYMFQEDANELEDKLGLLITRDISAFKAGGYTLLLMQASQGVGINLQQVDRIIYYSMDYSYTNYDQMIHRAWRIGRTSEVNIDIFLYKGSVETRIWKIIKNKINIADAIYDLLSD
jgi:SNF2 family DNA or RNA helicase